MMNQSFPPLSQSPYLVRIRYLLDNGLIPSAGMLAAALGDLAETPTSLINGHRLTETYQLHDIKYIDYRITIN